MSYADTKAQLKAEQDARYIEHGPEMVDAAQAMLAMLDHEDRVLAHPRRQMNMCKPQRNALDAAMHKVEGRPMVCKWCAHLISE